MINKIRSKVNCVQWMPNESYSHIRMKLDICVYLRKLGVPFYTECYFDNGLRADVVFIPDGAEPTAVEVLETEQTLSPHKKESYPCEIITVKASDFFDKGMLE